MNSSFVELADAIMQRQEQARVVSFDVFDTLLCRRVEPEWLKRCVGDELRRLVPGANLDLDVLAMERRRIETDVATERVARGLDNDAEHASVIARWVAQHFAADRADIAAHLLAYEVDLEKKLTFVAPYVRQILQTLHAAGKRLVYASDMYLSQASIDALLTHHDLRRFFSHGYVSVELGLRKATGRMFTKILDQEGLQPSQLLHIGDSPLGDWQAPSALGIQTVLVVDEADRQRRTKLRAFEWAARRDPARHATAFIDHVVRESGAHVKASANVNYETGLTFAPSLVAFCRKLIEDCAKNDIEHVYFLAREGLTFQRICRSITDGSRLAMPPASYLFLSRASTFLPSMRSLDRTDLSRFLRQYSRQSIRSFLKNLNLPESELLPLARECGLVDPDEVFDGFIDNPAVWRFLTHPEVHASFAVHHKKARELFLAYLEDRGVFRHRRVAFVDIGWKGSIQDNVVRAIEPLPRAPTVFGYYVGLTARSALKRGLLAELESNDPTERDVFRNSAMFEMLTTANHGSTTGYKWGKYQPHRAVPVLVHHKEEKKNATEFFASAQQAIFDWAKDYGQLSGAFPFTSDELKTGALAAVGRYVRYPTQEEANEFLRYSHVESFGVHEVTTYEWKYDWRSALRNLSPLRDAWNSLLPNPWREGALKRSKVPLLNFAYDCWYLTANGRPQPKATQSKA